MGRRIAVRFCLVLALAAGLTWAWRVRWVSAPSLARLASRPSASSDADSSVLTPPDTKPAQGKRASSSGNSINDPDSKGRLAIPEFSVDQGFYETNITVEIRCATPGSVIRFTTDSSEPTATTGSLYAGPLSISNTTVLRAAAFKTGWVPARVNTRTYIFPTDVIKSRVMRTSVTKHAIYGPQMRNALLGAPSLSLVTPRDINKNDAVKGSIEWLAPDGSRGFQEDCGVRYYGGDYTDFDKKNFRLYFRSEFGASKLKFPIFSGHEHGLAAVEEFDQLELRSGSHDMAQRGFYLSNVFADDSMLEMGHLNPHGRFVHLYINGTYWGVFHLRERWGAGMHHRYLGGSHSDYESINGNSNVGGWADPGVPYDGDGKVWARVHRLRSDYKAVKKWVDVPQYIDFMILWIFGRCEDEYRCVGPIVPGSGFKFYINDADGFFQSPAHPWYGEPSYRTARHAPGRQSGDGPGSLFSTLLAGRDPDYRVLLADRIYKAYFNTGALTPARTAARLKVRSDELGQIFVAEAARWAYRTPRDWMSVRDDVSSRWLPTRTEVVLGELRTAGLYPRLDAPVLNQQGGIVRAGFHVLIAGPPSGDVFFTIDGSDPRLPGGALAPAAQRYATGPLPIRPESSLASNVATRPVIDRNTVLKTRAREGNEWSALNETFFQTGPNPLEPGGVMMTQRNWTTPQNGDAEFLELSNVSSAAVNLRGSRFTQGIDFRFADNRDTLLAPGQKLVLVGNLFQFRSGHGPDLPVEGVYSKKRRKTDGRVTLSSELGQVIASRLIDEAKP